MNCMLIIVLSVHTLRNTKLGLLFHLCSIVCNLKAYTSDFNLRAVNRKKIQMAFILKLC